MNITRELRSDPDALASYLKAEAGRTGPYQCKDEERVSLLLKIRDFIEQRGGRLVIVNVPTSSFDFEKTRNMHRCFDEKITPIFAKENIAYLDLRDHKALGINDTHFLFPHYLDPQHMNIEGGMIFTQKILDAIK